MRDRTPTRTARAALHRRAEAARTDGRLAEAERLYRRLLRIDPDDSAALHWLGACRLARGEVEAGRPLLERAAALRPLDARCLYHLAEAQRATGDLDAAVAGYRRCIRLAPALPDPRRGLALALGALGRRLEAAAVFEECLPLAPADTGLHLLALHAFALAGERDRAGRLLAELADRGVERSRLAAAAADAARALTEAGSAGDAPAWWRRALGLEPGRAARWNDYGVLLQRLGRFAEAEEALRRAVSLDPSLGSARQNLALGGDRPADEADIAALRRQVNEAADATSRMRPLYALGRLLERSGRDAEAFACWREANAIERARQPFDADAHEAFVERLISLFDAGFFRERQGWGDPSDLPVPIVGLPRSGTTLVERILAAHPLVAAGGERDDLRALAARLPESGPGVRPFPEGLVDLDHDGARRLSTAYLGALRPLAGHGARHVTDKLPGNYVRLAMVGFVLPRARIVWCRRDPRDVALSCFATDFARGLRFATDIGDCLRVWRAQARLLAHWREVLPAPIHVVDYEQLVDTPEEEIGRLLAFVGLPPEPACLRFHERPGDVRTPGVWQVRQPIHGGSVGRWRRFARFAPELAVPAPEVEAWSDILPV